MSRRISVRLSACLLGGLLLSTTVGAQAADLTPTGRMLNPAAEDNAASNLATAPVVVPAQAAPTSTPVKIEIGAVNYEHTPIVTMLWSAVRGDTALTGWDYTLMWAKGTMGQDGKVTFGPDEKYPMSDKTTRALGIHRDFGDIYRFRVIGHDLLTGETAQGEHIVQLTNAIDLPSGTGKASAGWHLVEHPEYFGRTAAVTYRAGETITQTVTAAVDSTLTVQGTLLAQGGTAEISVDGRPGQSFTTTTDAPNTKDPYRRRLTTVPLPAGTHVVTIKSTSAGTLALDSLEVIPRPGTDRMGSVDRISTGDLNFTQPTQEVSWDVSHGPLGTRYRVTYAQLTLRPDGSRVYGPEKLWFPSTPLTSATFRGDFGEKYEVRVNAIWPDGRTSAVSSTVVHLAPPPIDITGVGADKNWHFVNHPSYLHGTALVTYQDKARWTTTVNVEDGQGIVAIRGTRLPRGAKATVYVDGSTPGEQLDTSGPVKYQDELGRIVCNQGIHALTVEANVSPGHDVLALDGYQIADGRTFRP
ncbi:hypothetical protein SAMN05421595_2570 [Austwickia chelonae]|uniref:Fibronectin type-III domain-containing protein n=1 Tax=Austwickia chelonae NBRC 105200 TaxID=1184607 RepID=K6WBQ4_9MICO|nr:hypothetical protein [Austwickia chelonae]GAB79262.1 hypothetical protein AUCHE_22_00320 [Austwickia chelonae NBRC 105200]SEW37704.1 hypothetical protein SAMN05421595_2570 [Austwickia chelonae]